MFLLFLAFLQIVTASDHSFLDQSKAQAEYYIREIQKDGVSDEHLWALTLLASSNEEVEVFIEKKIQQEEYTHPPLSLFKSIEPDFVQQLRKITFSTGSPNLLVALLLNVENKQAVYEEYLSEFRSFPESDINYQSLCLSLIEQKVITPETLPDHTFLLPHFFILFQTDYSRYLSKEYLQNIVSEWHLDAASFNLKLDASLSKITYFRVLYVLNKYSDIDFLYDFLINNKLFPNSSLKLRIYRFLDYSMFRLGHFNRNLEIARNFTLPLATYLNQEALRLQIKFTTGINLYHLGKMSQAEKIYQEVLAARNESYFHLRLSSLYNNLAITYYKLGKFDKYLNLQFRALKTAKEVNNYSHQLEILNNLFIYYSRLKNSKSALNYLKQAQELAKSHGDSVDMGKTYIYLGQFYRKFKGNSNKAFEYFTKAKKVLDPKNNSEHFNFLLVEQAKIYEQQQKFAEALKKYNQIISLTSKANSPNYIDALVNKAVVYLKAGNLFQAKRFITKFKKQDLNRLDFVQIVKAKTVEADYLHQTGHTTQALSILKPTLEQVIKRAKSSASMKTGFWYVADEYLNAFELAVSIYMETDQPKKAVELLDRLKTINDASLYQSPLVKASLLNETELTQYKRLTAKLDNARKNLLAAPKDERFDIQQTINQLKLKKKELDRKLTKQVDIPPVSVREVQNNLSAHELVLHITELKDKYYIARIFRNDVSIEIISLDEELRKLFEESVKQVANHNTDLNLLYSITKILDIKEIPDRIEKITIIPDSYLYRLPLAILPIEKPVHPYSYGEARYLIEKFETSYLTSLNEFKTNYDQPENRDYELNFVGYGVSQFDDYKQKPLVPLPFAETEVTTIANKLTNLSDTRTFINDSSTKEAFIRTAPDSRILHLATHSKVSERDPLFSTFYMSRTSTGTDSAYYDQIFAYELFELKLNNQMIMLNSCESGSGSYLQGTGIMGISRALQYAGANSLVLNLWPVNDMLASDFAVHFYSLLNKGKSKAEAMRATKLYFLENKNASPHFWGPYMLIGNDRPIVHPNREMNLLMAGTFSFYFLLMIGLSLFKRYKRKRE